MDIEITPHHPIITFEKTLIIVKQNMTYDNCYSHPDYILIKKTIETLTGTQIDNSHDLIQTLMIYMGHNVSMKMAQAKNGIFRTCSCRDVPEELAKIVFNTVGQYTEYGPDLRHETLMLSSYLHITSPIRRLVDLLNQLKFQENLGLIVQSPAAKQFYTKWVSQLDIINDTTRSIRKVQNECNMLNVLKAQEPGKFTYEAHIIHKTQTDSEITYTFHVPSLKYNIKYRTCEEYKLYSCHRIKLFIFKEEFNVKQKIKMLFIE